MTRLLSCLSLDLASVHISLTGTQRRDCIALPHSTFKALYLCKMYKCSAFFSYLFAVDSISHIAYAYLITIKQQTQQKKAITL